MDMKVVIISGSPRENANTEIMMKHVVEYVKQKDVEVRFINLSEGGFEYYRGWVDDYNEKTLQAAKDIMEADVWLIGTPIYNSMYSAALKNLFEFVNYKETEGKTAGLAIIASGMIGFNIVVFFIICLISRGLRFFIVSYLSYKFGDIFSKFMEKEGSKWFAITGIVIVAIAVFIYFVIK